MAPRHFLFLTSLPKQERLFSMDHLGRRYYPKVLTPTTSTGQWKLSLILSENSSTPASLKVSRAAPALTGPAIMLERNGLHWPRTLRLPPTPSGTRLTAAPRAWPSRLVENFCSPLILGCLPAKAIE